MEEDEVRVESLPQNNSKFQQSMELGPLVTVKIEEPDSDVENVPLEPLAQVKIEAIQPLDVLETHIENSSEVQASDYFVNTVDLVNIKREIVIDTENSIKTELLSHECYLPVLKSEVKNDLDFHQPCSSKQSQEMGKSKVSVKKDLNKYPCPVCKKNLSSNGICTTITENFPDLIKDHENRKFQCIICSKKFKRKHHLLHHARSHGLENVFDCMICSRRFLCKLELNDHLKTHTSEKPFGCKICSKHFKRKLHLTIHNKIHSGEKPFQCEICSKRFRQNNVLVNHVRTHTGEKPFKCNVCSKQFSQKTHLQYHQYTHSNEKPFSCDICKERFTQKSHLNSHSKIHTGEKPFSCEFCSKKFARPGDKKKHLRIHTGEKPYECELCSKGFTQKAHLNSHNLRVHAA